MQTTSSIQPSESYYVRALPEADISAHSCPSEWATTHQRRGGVPGRSRTGLHPFHEPRSHGVKVSRIDRATVSTRRDPHPVVVMIKHLDREIRVAALRQNVANYRSALFYWDQAILGAE